MRIAAFIGSLRRASVNRKVFRTYCELAGSSATFNEVNYRDFPLYDSDLHEKEFPTSVVAAGKVVADAQAVMFFSPEYNYSVPGPLKNAIDWLSRLEGSPFAAKPAAIVGASPGRVGTARMQYHLRQIAVFFDMRMMNKPEAMIGGAGEVVGETGVHDEATRERLLKHFKAFTEFAKNP